MSTISTDTASVTTNASQSIEKSSEDDMIVSCTRHRRTPTDATYTYQLPLSWYNGIRSSDVVLLADLKNMLRNRLDTDMDNRSIVWRMSETGQIAFVNSSNSFNAAVIDHKNANKKTIQLFVVSNSSKSIALLPGSTN